MEIPFAERPTCTVKEAIAASGIGLTKIYALLGDGRLQSTKLDGRRLIIVPSLLALLKPTEPCVEKGKGVRKGKRAR